MVVTNEATHTGQAVIARVVELRTVTLGLHNHRAELVEREGLPLVANAFLLEDGRATVFALNQDIADKEKRGENDKTGKGNEKIKLQPVDACEKLAYYRDENGIKFVPKIKWEQFILE